MESTIKHKKGQIDLNNLNLTGTPEAPTPTAGSLGTQIANKEYVLANSGGASIPLAGTTVGNPVSGDIEILGESNDLKIYNRFYDGGETVLRQNSLQFGDGSISLVSENNDLNQVAITVGSNIGDINVNSTFPLSRGITASQDFSPNITDLDYTQKIYVDTKAPINTPTFTGQVEFDGGARCNGTNLYFNTGGTGIVDGLSGSFIAMSFPSNGWYSNNKFTAPVLRTTGYTVATLPTGTQGDTAYVTDALAPTYLTTVVGGGAVVCPVFYNGTNWVAY